MRLAFVLANYLPHVGGVEKHVAALAAELRSRGVESWIFNLERPGSREQDGIPVIGLGRRWETAGVLAWPGPGARGDLRQALLSNGISHVSVHTRFFPATWLGLQVARELGLPAVLTEHGGGPVAVESPSVRWASRVVDVSAGRWALRQADGLLAVSAKSAEFVRDLSGRCPTVVGNGIDVDWWQAGEPAPDRARLVFAGRLVPEKGWGDFLAVLSACPPEFRAVMAGSGPDEEALHQRIASLGLGTRVQVLGQVSREVLRAHLVGAIYVNPSTAAEGLQTTLLEAAAAGARIATYDVGGAAETRDTGAQMRIVPVGGLELLTNATMDLSRQPSKKSPGLRHYDWDQVADRYLAVLRTVGGE